MLTLSYGFKKPQSGDNGSTVFPALEGNFQQLNDHSHNGVDSALLPISSLTVVKHTVAAADWVDLGGGNYRQKVAISGGLQYDAIVISFRDLATGNYLNLTTEKFDATNYYVYINDNSLDLTAVYGA